MCSVASSSFTTSLPLSGGNAPGRPAPFAWWQAEQLAVYKLKPLAVSFPPAAAAPTGRLEFELGAAVAVPAVAPSLAAPSLPAHAGCCKAARYAINASALCVGTTTPWVGAKALGRGTGVTPAGARSTTAK